MQSTEPRTGSVRGGAMALGKRERIASFLTLGSFLELAIWFGLELFDQKFRWSNEAMLYRKDPIPAGIATFQTLYASAMVLAVPVSGYLFGYLGSKTYYKHPLNWLELVSLVMVLLCSSKIVLMGMTPLFALIVLAGWLLPFITFGVCIGYWCQREAIHA